MMELINQLSDPLVTSRARHALGVISRTLSLYSPDQIAFSFNGGKDSTVLLHLLRAGIQHHYESNGGAPPAEAGALGGMRSFVFTHPDDFQEVDSFIRTTDQQYNLAVEYLADDFKQGLESFLGRTGVKAVILGTRAQDPNAVDQQLFCPSSAGWPAFMRINPIFDWAYHDVWSFLLSTKVAYCSLYDHGFTSLGGKSNTKPNSALQREDGSFAPAHLLADGRLERAGRASRKAAAEVTSPHASLRTRYTGALVLIGDELLAGKVTDTASVFLCQELRSIGYQVTRAVVIPDDVAAISEEVKRVTEAVDLVITCGGIGPTLDDVTMEGIALALGRPLVRHPEFEARLRDMFGPQLTASHLKMSEAPAGCTQLIDYLLDDGQVSRFPILKCGANIFVLPGVPHLMRQKWRGLKQLLVTGRTPEPFHNQVFRLALNDETVVARSLEAVQQEIGPEVAIGSYPVSAQPDGAQLLITLDSRHVDLLRSASQQVDVTSLERAVLSDAADKAPS